LREDEKRGRAEQGEKGEGCSFFGHGYLLESSGAKALSFKESFRHE
jgi:hypothetical protein